MSATLFIILILMQPPTIKAEVDRNKIRVGDQIKYTIEINKSPKTKVELPKLNNLGNFEILNYKIKESSNKIRADYTITVFHTGVDTIPSLTIKYVDEKGNQGEVQTEELLINIVSILDENASDIKDIKPPESMPRNFLALVLILGALCIAGAYLYLRLKRKRVVTTEEVVEMRPAHEIAYDRLKALAAKDYLKLNKIKQYYIELSDIIRRYIEARYNILAPCETTYELTQNMKKKKIKFSHIQMIGNFLNACDLVKFAKYVPATDEIRSNFEAAKNIIDQTKEEVVADTQQ